jgi:tetratricopeptide (TPR) repeat protein
MQNDLTAAIEQHQQGCLDRAAEAYRAILSQDPEHADAWHLLGVVLHQQGDHGGAAERIGRAIALAPGVAAYHANLAEAYRALRQYDRAIGCCRVALRLKPDCAEAANHLGLALLAQGKTAAAVEHFQHALRLRPELAMFHNNLGTALRQLGDKNQAIDHFRRAVQLDPQLAEGHTNAGQLLLERKDVEDALFHCREAARLRPDLAEAHNNLGNVLRELDRLEEAKSSYAEVLRLNPDLALAYSNMGQALQQEGKLDDALTWYQHALKLEPESARIHCNLASAFLEQEKHEDSAAHYERAIQFDPNYAEAHNGLGLLRHKQGNDEAAQAHYRHAIQLQPDLASAHANLGVVLQELSAFDEAQSCFREALRHDPKNAAAYAQLAMIFRDRLLEEDRKAMKKLLANSHTNESQRMALHYGLAHVLDADGDYASAAAHLRQANALQEASWRKLGQGYNPAAHADYVSSTIATMTPEFFRQVRGFGVDSERQIFIVGLPRSGTTLVEQILASHSQVFGAGELRDVSEDLESLPKIMKSADSAIECLGRLDGETARAVAEAHLARLSVRNASAARIVDKMPDNYLHLGLIATLFPRAKVIHCRRDLRDVAVSCWMTQFVQIRWASDPGHLSSRFREYRRLMEHWRRVLPVPLLEVDYEETVADLDMVARRLVAACGLEWEPTCLDFHKTRRPVRTASVRQVRQPIHTRSVARWKNYEQALAALFAELQPLNLALPHKGGWN